MTRGLTQLEIQGPQGEVNAVNLSKLGDGASGFALAGAEAPGLYRWRKPGEPAVLAMANVQLPAAESAMSFLRPQDVIEQANNVSVARSVQEMQTQAASQNQTAPVGRRSSRPFCCCSARRRSWGAYPSDGNRPRRGRLM